MSAPIASPLTIRRCAPSAASNGQTPLMVAAEIGGELRGAVLAQILPGRVASIAPPQIQGSDVDGDLARQLLLRLNDELRAEGVELAQALLTPDDSASAAAFRGGGYEHASDLLYLAAEADSFPEQPPALPLELLPASGVEPDRLAKLVDATYAGTLDCPRIDGLRATADVLAGYRAVGKSADQHWRLVRAETSDVGCLLLADHPDTRQFEIVYVGLIPAVRGRGWGLELTRHAQWLARQANCERVVLAVDAANDPAIRIYSAAGFRAWDRQAVWIKPLAGGPTGLSATT